MGNQSGDHIPNVKGTDTEVLRPAARGLSNREIADEVGISEDAVTKRVQRFCEKHDFNRRTVAHWADRHAACCLAIP